MIGFIFQVIYYQNTGIFNGDLKLDNLVFDNMFNVTSIDFDCSIYLDRTKDSFKIKGYTEGYASDNHIDCFE